MSLGSFGGDAPYKAKVSGGGGESGPGGLGSLIDVARQAISEGPEGAYTIGRIYSGSFARTVAAGSGDQLITGIPFKPYMIFFVAASTSETASGGASIGFGFDPALSLTKVGLFRLTGAALYWATSSNAVRLWESGTIEWAGDISAIALAAGGTTTVTFTWVMTGTPTFGADVSYAAFGRG